MTLERHLCDLFKHTVHATWSVVMVISDLLWTLLDRRGFKLKAIKDNLIALGEPQVVALLKQLI